MVEGMVERHWRELWVHRGRISQHSSIQRRGLSIDDHLMLLTDLHDLAEPSLVY
jgi:hypothetical protein